MLRVVAAGLVREQSPKRVLTDAGFRECKRVDAYNIFLWERWTSYPTHDRVRKRFACRLGN